MLKVRRIVVVGKPLLQITLGALLAAVLVCWQPPEAVSKKVELTSEKAAAPTFSLRRQRA